MRRGMNAQNRARLGDHGAEPGFNTHRAGQTVQRGRMGDESQIEGGEFPNEISEFKRRE